MNMDFYDWLEENFPIFLRNVGLEKQIPYSSAIISADGDKCYSYEDKWNLENIPFAHGVALYLITKLGPYSSEVRNTVNGWVAPDEWVIANYTRFLEFLPAV